jgi:hypothetical protein
MATDFLNKRQLNAAYKRGDIDAVAKQLVRYGVIAHVHDWEAGNDTGPNVGYHRRMRVVHHSQLWEVHKHNGKVKAVTIFHTL